MFATLMLTRRDYVVAMLGSVLRPQFLLRVVPVWVFFAAFLVCAKSGKMPSRLEEVPSFLSAMAAPLAVMIGIFGLLLLIAVWVAFRVQGLPCQVRYSLDSAGFHSNSDLGCQSVPWHRITRTVRFWRLATVIVDRGMNFFIVPRRIFNDDADFEAFLSYIELHRDATKVAQEGTDDTKESPRSDVDSREGAAAPPWYSMTPRINKQSLTLPGTFGRLDTFLVKAAAATGLVVAGDYLLAGSAGEFYSEGISYLLTFAVSALVASVIVTHLYRRRDLGIPLATAFADWLIVFGIIAFGTALIASSAHVDRQYELEAPLGLSALALFALGSWASIHRILKTTWPRTFVLGGLFLAIAASPLYGLQYWASWYPAYDEAEEVDPVAAAAYATWQQQEQIYYRQFERLDSLEAGLAPQRPGVADLYFVGFASFASQAVFEREVASARALMDARFDTAARSALLINSFATLDSHPIASGEGLRKALQIVGDRIDPAEDVVVLYLTSHGSRDQGLAVDFPGLNLRSIQPATLKQALDDAGIKWRVVIVSACYSGIFVDALADERTLVMSAAARDRTSFGCTNERDFTYFGEALFDQALREEVSFAAAFEKARESIARREALEGLTPSNPQMHLGEEIAIKLQEIEGRLSRRFEALLPAARN